jgi:hypothetical protein
MICLLLVFGLSELEKREAPLLARLAKSRVTKEDCEFNDEAIQKAADACDEDAAKCEAKYKADCERFWQSTAKEAECFQEACDKVCRKSWQSWCRGLSTGAIAGIVVGVVVVVVIVAVLVWFFVIRKKE